MDDSTLKGYWTCPLISGAHKAAGASSSHPSHSFLRIVNHLLQSPVLLSERRRIERLILSTMRLLTLRDRHSPFFLHKRVSASSRISLVNHPISYSINRWDITREFARCRFFSQQLRRSWLLSEFLTKKKNMKPITRNEISSLDELKHSE